MPRYTVVLFTGPDGGYTAVVPSLPGCVTEGDTLEEALAMAKQAIELYLESAADHGEEVMEERHPPVIATVELKHSAKAALG